MFKVMLVEDDLTMFSLLSTLLEMEGFEVVKLMEENPVRIIQTLQQQLPDLVLLDVHLRQFNGLDLLKQIKQDVRFHKVKILMSSGMNFRAECLEAGADDFILKPYMPDALIAQIHRLLKPVK